MKATAPSHMGQTPRALLPARTKIGGGAPGQRGHPALMIIGRSDAGYRPAARGRDEALRPMGPDAPHAYSLLRDIQAAYRAAPRGQRDQAQVPYSLERAMQAARVGKHAVGGISYRERIARMLRWLDVQGTIDFTEGDRRWSILLRTTPAALQYNPLGEWRHESQQQASELLILWQRLWQEKWDRPYHWPPPRLVTRNDEDRWVDEMQDSHRFLAAQLDCGVAPQLIAQVYLGYISGQVQWKVTASPIRIHNSFKWHGGRPKSFGLTTCHAHFDRLLHDVRAAIDLQARALDQEPPPWLYEQPDEVDRRVAVTSAKIIRRAKRLRAAGKPAPSDQQARAIAVRRNQPEGTVIAPRGSDHLYEAATARPRRGRCALHSDQPKSNCAECQPTFPN